MLLDSAEDEAEAQEKVRILKERFVESDRRYPSLRNGTTYHIIYIKNQPEWWN